MHIRSLCIRSVIHHKCLSLTVVVLQLLSAASSLLGPLQATYVYEYTVQWELVAGITDKMTPPSLLRSLLLETQGTAPTNLGGLWKEYDEIVALTESLKEKQGVCEGCTPLPMVCHDVVGGIRCSKLYMVVPLNETTIYM